MIVALIAYFISFFCVTKYKKTNRLKHDEFPRLKMSKSGVKFFSNRTHFIKTIDAKIMQLRNVLYLKTGGNLVIISNVENAKIFDDKLYFTALGEVKILFDCKKFYRYFALEIKSNQFNLDKIKQLAILDLMNHNFNINFSKLAKKYIKIIEKALNICVFKEKLIIKPNKFRLSYVVRYKVNNIIKRVVVNETI